MKPLDPLFRISNGFLVWLQDTVNPRKLGLMAQASYKVDTKVGCVFPMAFVSIKLLAEYGPTVHWEDVPHFKVEKWTDKGPKIMKLQMFKRL